MQELMANQEAERERTWPGLTDAQKVKADEYRWLRENFPPDQEESANKAIVLKHDGYNMLLLDRARRMSLKSACIDIPRNHPIWTQSQHIMTVIAKSETFFEQNAEWKRFSRQMKKMKELSDKRAADTKKQNQQAVFLASVKGSSWEVTGKYSVRCKTIEK
jgi:hypothetical protein